MTVRLTFHILLLEKCKNEEVTFEHKDRKFSFKSLVQGTHQDCRFLPHMGPEHATREKIIVHGMVIFLFFDPPFPSPLFEHHS